MLVDGWMVLISFLCATVNATVWMSGCIGAIATEDVTLIFVVE